MTKEQMTIALEELQIAKLRKCLEASPGYLGQLEIHRLCCRFGLPFRVVKAVAKEYC